MGFENGQSAAKRLKSWYDSGEGSTTILVGGVPIKISRFDWEKVDFDGGKFFVYCLACPITFEIRYVGITINYPARRRAHLFGLKGETNNWKVHWIKKLKAKKIRPIMLQIDDDINLDKFITKGDFKAFANTKEADVIKLLAKNKFRLINHDKLVSTEYEYGAPGHHKNKKHVFQYSLSGSFLAEWESLKSVINYYDMSYPGLSCAMSRKHKSHGFYWSLDKKDRFEPNPPAYKTKKCYQYDLNGNFICGYNSVAEAARLTGINRNCIKDNINGFQMSAHRYVFTATKKEKNDRYRAKCKRYESLIIKEDIV